MSIPGRLVRRSVRARVPIWPPPSGSRLRLREPAPLGHEKLVVDQGSIAVSDPADLGVAAAGIEGAGSGLGVVGVEPDGISGPCPGDAFDLLQAASADSLALPGRGDGHGEKIQGPVAGREVTTIDGPRFLGGEVKGGDDLPISPR